MGSGTTDSRQNRLTPPSTCGSRCHYYTSCTKRVQMDGGRRRLLYDGATHATPLHEEHIKKRHEQCGVTSAPARNKKKNRKREISSHSSFSSAGCVYGQKSFVLKLITGSKRLNRGRQTAECTHRIPLFHAAFSVCPIDDFDLGELITG